MFQPKTKKGAGLSPAARAGLMFQPKAKRGWTQPQPCELMFQPTEETKNHDWLLCMSTVTSELISFLHAERAQCTFCKQEDD
jgi:hypothetical protein